MTANQLFWTYAFLTMAAIVALLAAAVRAARRSSAAAHRRRVLLAAGVAGLFVLAYVGKVAWLGREDKSDWSALVLTFLYVHETFVLLMLVTGGIAAGIGRRIYPGYVDGGEGEPNAGARRRHARFGHVCLVAAALALVTGCVVYGGIVMG